MVEYGFYDHFGDECVIFVIGMLLLPILHVQVSYKMYKEGRDTFHFIEVFRPSRWDSNNPKFAKNSFLEQDRREGDISRPKLKTSAKKKDERGQSFGDLKYKMMEKKCIGNY